MTRDPRQTAEACFAVARRATTTPGEREAAINRGKAIAERAGLDLDSFDIPGRSRSRAQREDDLLDRLNGSSAYGYFVAETSLERAFRDLERAMNARRGR